jgi:hypothetical protein
MSSKSSTRCGATTSTGHKDELVDVTTAAKPHLNTREFQELEELVAKYADIFARDSED